MQELPRLASAAPKMIRKLFAVVLALSLAACASIERAALPDPILLEPKWQRAAPNATTMVDDTAWDVFLARYLSVDAAGINRLNYAKVSAIDHERLKAYLFSLEQVDTKAMTQNQQLAFWINLYNAKTVDLVLEAYPVDSILKIKDGFLPTGPWRRKVLRVNGEALSLNDIEHRIVRPVFRDARIHYALNCAASGCPNLMPRAWRAATLEDDLKAAEHAYVNDPRGVRFDSNGRLTLSKIYRWFREDFAQSEAELLAVLARAAEPTLRSKLARRTRVDRYAYDWSLNDTQN